METTFIPRSFHIASAFNPTALRCICSNARWNERGMVLPFHVHSTSRPPTRYLAFIPRSWFDSVRIGGSALVSAVQRPRQQYSARTSCTALASAVQRRQQQYHASVSRTAPASAVQCKRQPYSVSALVSCTASDVQRQRRPYSAGLSGSALVSAVQRQRQQHSARIRCAATASVVQRQHLCQSYRASTSVSHTAPRKPQPHSVSNNLQPLQLHRRTRPAAHPTRNRTP